MLLRSPATTRFLFVCSIALAILLVSTFPANGSEAPDKFPSRPIAIIVPFAVGGGLDLATRMLAKYAEPELGQNITIVNQTARGNIQGNLDAIMAAPDGYTLGAWGTGLVTDELIIRNVPYTHESVKPVCLFADDPEVICVSRSFAEEHGIKTLEDLFVVVRDKPGHIGIGMGGNWTTHDFLRLKMENQAGVKFNRMPFLGGRPALQAVVDGNCTVALPFVSELLSLLHTGKVIPLAVAYGERISQLPGIPSVAELGYPDMTQTIWRVLTAPQGTPDAVIHRLENAFKQAIANPDLQQEAEAIGANMIFKSAQATAELVASEYAYFAKMTEELGLRPKNP